MKRNILNWNGFLKENLSDDHLNSILDKISKYGIDALSNYEKTLLKSYSDKSIDVEEEIQKHINKFKIAKQVIKDVSLEASDNELEKNIGRYVKFSMNDKTKKYGLIQKLGMIYEIISIQKHWGYVNGKYVSDKIGYRLAQVGNDNDFGCVGDVDEIEFVDMTEDQAIQKNMEVMKKINK